MRPIVLLLGLALMAGGCDRQKDGAPQAPAGEAGVGLDRSKKGAPAPATVIKDPEGEAVTLAEFKGAPLLVNLWATWCAPCVKELPTLDRLAKDRGEALAVVAVSQDMGPQSSVRAFLDKLGVDALGAYHDPDMALSEAFGAQILPTTVLYDANGREVWRYTGDLDWSGPEAATLLAEAAASPAAAR